MSSSNRYELLEKLGSGSFAAVYRARDKELGREVAIKQLHDEYLADPRRLARYWQEAQLLASLHHPNIVTIYDIVREKGWLVMELMTGNLADRMQGRPMDLRALRAMLVHGLRALKYLHAQGIIHGDVKPGNLMLDQRKRVKLGDFGLARRASDESGSLIKGSTKYMAPEVVSDDFGDVGPQSDLYSLGFSAYELMCGNRFDELFPGLNAFGRNPQMAWMMWHAAADRQLPEISRVLKDVPDDLQKAIGRLTAKDPAKRYRTADEALSDLNVDLKLVGGAEEPTQSGSDPRRLWIAGGALGVSLLMSAAILFWPSTPKQTATAAGKKSLGIVREVLPETNRLVVRDVDSGALEELGLGRRQNIYLLNRKENILLRELQPGDHVVIELDATDPTQVHGIIADRPVSNTGIVRSLELAEKRLVVGLTDGNLRDDLPLRVPESVELRLNRQSVPLRDLQTGDVVELTHLAEPNGRKGRIVETLSAKRPVTLVGYVQAFLPDTGELAIELSQSANVSLIKLPAAADCKVTINGTPTSGGVADLKPGDRISARHDTELHEVAATRQENLDGVIAALDDSANTISVSLASGELRKIVIDDAAELTLSLEPIQPVDLRRFDQVRIAYRREGDVLRATTIDARRPPQTDRWALVLGTQSYQDSSLSPVPSAIEDARAIFAAMTKRYAISERRGRMLLDASLAQWQTEIKDVCANANPGTQIVISISGHAYADDQGQVYLAPRDFDLENPARTGLALADLARYLNDSPSNDQLVLLDITPNIRGRDARRQVSGREVLAKLDPPFRKASVLLACGDDETSLVDPKTRAGLFGLAVARGFQGAADADRDLHVTADELYPLVRAQVQAAAAAQSARQTPLLQPRHD